MSTQEAKNVATAASPKTSGRPIFLRAQLPYAFAGMAFGFVAIKSEIVSWYRIQEMFRFDSFHMYGIIGSAVLAAALSLWLMRRTGASARDGMPIEVAPKAATWPRYIVGGTIFGLGWALAGACPGPILVLLGAGFPTLLMVLLGAIAGTYLYGALRDRLPH